MGGCILSLSLWLWRSLFSGLLLAGVFLVVGAGQAHAETTLASWYGPGFEGSPTASGETFDPWGFTAAHKTLPLGTELLVSYGENSVAVTVNDRGPYVAGRDLDLSLGAAEALGLTDAGVDYVEYTYAGTSTPQYGYDQYGYSDGYYAGNDTAGSGGMVGYTGYAEDIGYEQPVSYGGGLVGGSYVVHSGETLSGISARLGVSVEDLAAYSGVADPDVIYAGQTLYY